MILRSLNLALSLSALSVLVGCDNPPSARRVPSPEPLPVSCLEGLPAPDFCERCLRVAAANPSLGYFYYTNLPLSALLFAPDLPDNPSHYSDWPRPSQSGQGNSNKTQSGILDKQLNHSSDSNGQPFRIQASLSLPKASVGLPESQDIKGKTRFGSQNWYLFIPGCNSDFDQSTHYRYVPPDQFIHLGGFCGVVFPSASQQVIRQAILEAKSRQLPLVTVSSTTYPKSIHNQSWWTPYSVFKSPFLLPPISATDRASGEASHGSNLTASHSTGDQSEAIWYVMRQIHINTGLFIDMIVDGNGTEKSAWPVGSSELKNEDNGGSIFELWRMPWGRTGWRLITSHSAVADQEVYLNSSAGEVVRTGQKYRVGWTLPQGLPGQYTLQIWQENLWGEPLGSSQSYSVNPESSSIERVATLPEGFENFALWRLSPNGIKVRLASLRQRTAPQPQIEFCLQPETPNTTGSALLIKGHYFPERGKTRIVADNLWHKVLIRELMDKESWEVAFNAQDYGLHGEWRVQVICADPGSSPSEDPSSWPQVVCASQRLRFKN